MSVYVIKGVSGEYDMETTWSVKAFLDKNMANAYLALIRDWIINHSIIKKSFKGEYRWRELIDITSKNPFDPEMIWQNNGIYDGAEYYIEEIELLQ